MKNVLYNDNTVTFTLCNIWSKNIETFNISGWKESF